MNSRKLVAIGAAFGLAIAGTATGFAVTASAATAQLPCDIYAAAGTPCVAANSTTRALFEAYNGPLYTVKRASDGHTLVIDTVAAGGVANAAAQDAFLAGTTGTIVDIADQTTRNNDLAVGPAGGNGPADKAASATALPLTVDGQKVYGVDIAPGDGYADDDTWMIPTGHQAQGVYMVTSAANVNGNCCADYGNAELNRDDNGDGHMEAASITYGAYIGADMENGIWGLGSPSSYPFITAMVRANNTTSYTVEAGNADSGTLSATTLPLTGDYKPMSLEGGMVLGTGGDNSNTDSMDWTEGAITAGNPSAATEAAVQAEIVSAGYAGITLPKGAR